MRCEGVDRRLGEPRFVLHGHARGTEGAQHPDRMPILVEHDGRARIEHERRALCVEDL